MQLINYKNIIEENIKNTLSEISRLKNELLNVECVKRVFPTDSNFFLIEFNNAEKVYQELLENEILTSKRSPQIPDCIRINVGKRDENNKLINVLKSI
jgi:histidinol-phosphate aminotransferase